MSMQSILAASQSMSTMQAMQSAKTQMASQANILRGESKQDGGDEKKTAKATELDTKANDLMSDLMTEVTEVNETLKPDESTPPQSEETTKEPNTDKITITKPATGEAGAEGAEAPAEMAIGEPVMYKADGNISPKVAEKKSGDIDVSA